MRLGNLIKLLKTQNPENRLMIFGPDDPSFEPSGVSSYRGGYSELAIEFQVGDEDDPMTVGRFLPILKAAVGTTFTGWKGGDYTMSEHTKVWIANSGYSGGIAVNGIQEGYDVTYLTFQRED